MTGAGPANRHSSSPPVAVVDGARIGATYRVIRTLGEGAMGIVVLAYDETLEREVAVKLVRPALVAGDALRERFLSEARAMARVNHHNVVRVYSFGDHDGVPYFVMEYVPGWSLDAWFSAHEAQSISREKAVRLLVQICQGVAAIHAANTVHGDLKPGNIRLGPNFRVAVTDMGLARVLDAASRDQRRPLAGSPAYMAPEVATQGVVDPALEPRIDIYALGCIAHELLTGRLPVARAGPEVYVEAIAGTTDLVLPSELCPSLPTSFDAVLLRALETEPVRRTPSARAFLNALTAAHDAHAPQAEAYRILIAEDDEDFRVVLEIALRREFPAAEIESVGDGRAALEAYLRKPHSIALIDLRMPALDGIELTTRLRSHDPDRAMPIIVLTASGGAAEWQRLAALGADGFLVKPVNFADVFTLVRRALGERSSGGSMPPSAAPKSSP